MLVSACPSAANATTCDANAGATSRSSAVPLAATTSSDTVATRVTLELCGFDAESSTLLLTARTLTCEASAGVIGIKRSRPESFMRREFADLQNWDRQLSRAHKQQECDQQQSDAIHTQPFERLPTRRMRKLMEQSWLKHDAAHGWRLELQKNVAAIDAWLTAAFARLPREQQRAFLDSEAYQRHKLARAHERADVEHARGLQQYFTSESLVAHTIARVAAVLGPALAPSSTVTEVSDSDTSSTDALAPLRCDRIVWLEPSCGDGRFVSALLARGAQRVVGVEIDRALCIATRTAVRDAPSHCVEVLESDFLTSQRASSALLTGLQSQSVLPPMVCVVGNPPFGNRVEAALSTDLIQRFVAHAAREWRAAFIAFIVPERCACPAYVAQTLATLADASVGDGSDGSTWRLALSEPLNGFDFEFRSTKHVKQPSALLVYERMQEQEQHERDEGVSGSTTPR